MIINKHKKHLPGIIRKSLILLFIFSSGCFIVKAQDVERVIIPGNYPDPSIVCANNGYYIVSSSSLEVPGLPIWHSADLKHWTKIGYGLTSRIGDVWAPDMVHMNDKWYIYFTAMVDRGMGNFVITADKPEGPWSKPLKLDLRGIDPGHLLLPDGRLYMFMSGGAAAELDKSGMKVIGEQKQTYKSWTIPDDYVVECNCTEGPKPFYYNGYIYLILAQGGTTGPSTSHMAVAAKAKSIEGPWEFSPYNPIVRTKDRSEEWWSKGHGTVFQGIDEKWYIVFHAYENSFQTLGRQVLITPIEWTEDGWFKEASSTELIDVKGNDFIDNFNSDALNLSWCFYNDSASARVTLKDGELVMKAKGGKASKSNPMLFTAGNKKYEVVTKVTIQENTTTGLVFYYNEQAFWGITLSNAGIGQIVKAENPRGGIAINSNSVFLKLLNDRNDISYFYSLDGTIWKKLERSHDISGFNANTLGNYRSTKVGLITYGSGQASFDSFSYKALD